MAHCHRPPCGANDQGRVVSCAIDPYHGSTTNGAGAPARCTRTADRTEAEMALYPRFFGLSPVPRANDELIGISAQPVGAGSGGGAGSCPVPGDLRPVAAGAHVAPATPSSRGAIDEEPAAGVIGADPQPLQVVVGKVMRQ